MFLEFQARTTARGNLSSLQPFLNIRQFEVWSLELSIWVLRVFHSFFFQYLSHISISCVYSSGSWKHIATLIALPLRQTFHILHNQSFSSLLYNCWFVDWGLTFSSKGRLLRSGILCRVTVYESVMFPSSCCLSGEWDGNTQRCPENTHAGLYRITVQSLEKRAMLNTLSDIKHKVG